jgi:hypothetical protein
MPDVANSAEFDLRMYTYSRISRPLPFPFVIARFSSLQILPGIIRVPGIFEIVVFT